MVSTYSEPRSIPRSIITITLALLVVLGPAAHAVDAASTNVGWSSFSTGTWEPEIPWPDDVEVLGARSIRGWIAKGTSHQTPYYVYDSGVKGPTVAIVGGVHGDEPAGAQAAWTIKDYSVKKGRLLVIPEANRPALRAGTRSSSLGDLNRDFPRTQSDRADTSLARSIWSVMVKYKPDWLVDLHEGYSYHLVNSKSVGQTVIYYPKANASSMAKAMAAAANRLVSNPKHAFTVLQYPAKGTLARSVSIRLGTKGMIVETADKQAMSLRVAEHVAAVNAMLSRLGMR